MMPTINRGEMFVREYDGVTKVDVLTWAAQPMTLHYRNTETVPMILRVLAGPYPARRVDPIATVKVGPGGSCGVLVPMLWAFKVYVAPTPDDEETRATRVAAVLPRNSPRWGVTFDTDREHCHAGYDHWGPAVEALVAGAPMWLAAEFPNSEEANTAADHGFWGSDDDVPF